MPSDVTLVREAVDSFDTEPSRSRLMGVEKPMLVELGLIIVDKDRHAHEGFEHMAAEFGDAAVRKSAYYEFVAEFRSRFDRIRRRYRERLARLNIEHATKGHGDDMASVLQVQLMRLLAEKAVGTDDLAQLEGKELGAMIAMIDGWTRAAMKREEIDLKVAEGERKAAKLEEDLRKLRIENDQREERRKQAAEKAKGDVDRIANQKGEITRADVLQMIDSIMKGEAA